MKHKHAELIKAWADGAKIERRGHIADGKWYEDSVPQWYESLEYRIKPEERVVRWLWIHPKTMQLFPAYATEQEAAMNKQNLIKAEWSRMEFDK